MPCAQCFNLNSVRKVVATYLIGCPVLPKGELRREGDDIAAALTVFSAQLQPTRREILSCVRSTTGTKRLLEDSVAKSDPWLRHQQVDRLGPDDV
jgi:hypothetical protein